ncbi:MAG: hypothetical protein QXZ25_05775 [Candidatus Bathyarchaeia archaeon]
MKNKRNKMFALSLALLLALPIIAPSISVASANGESGDVEDLPSGLLREGVWYKFTTPLITLLFPAEGKKPMFVWWYTDNASEIYIVKFKGLIEYLTFDKPYYVRRFQADGLTITERLREKFVEPKMGRLKANIRERLMNRIAHMKQQIIKLFGLHPAYLPFSASMWELEGPEPMVNGWSFNFTLKSVPMRVFDFAEDNIQIRCRFYNTTTTEIIDADHNYTVVAGQLKFDFVVKNWEWNIDRIMPFLEELKNEYDIEIPAHQTGLALWINLASIKIEDLGYAQTEVESQAEDLVEASSQMMGAMINNQYYPVKENQTSNGEDEKPIQTRLNERVRIQFAKKETTLAGFLEFVPWARLLNETGDTVEYVNVTASYIAAGAHMRLFLCYPYFGNYTLEHDPTIGLASSPAIPTLMNPNLLVMLVGTTVAIAIVLAAVKLRRKTVNIVSV